MTLKAANPAPLDYNVQIDIVCTIGVEHDVTAEFRKLESLFFFVVKSKYACAQELGRLSIIFHQYRILIMLTALALGIFCNYWGMKYLSYTLRIIGFTMCFMFSFFVLNALFYEGGLISGKDLQSRFYIPDFNYYWGIGRIRNRTFGGLPKLHLQYFKKSDLLE